MKVGGYSKQVDDERLGPTLVIAASVILAIRTARHNPLREPMFENRALEAEIDVALKLAHNLLTTASHRWPRLFKQKDVPWYMPSEEDSVP